MRQAAEPKLVGSSGIRLTNVAARSSSGAAGGAGELRRRDQIEPSVASRPGAPKTRQCRVIALTAAAVRVAKGFCATQLEVRARGGLAVWTPANLRPQLCHHRSTPLQARS